ncbi:MAG TPA: hypothetical protein GXX51_02195 [Firmicutes bacterium]|nr:hypothetical protein [Bacillota bacterium]
MSKEDLYGGSRLSRFLGGAAFFCLALAVISIFSAGLAPAGVYFILSLILSYLSYKLAGGARNPAFYEDGGEPAISNKGENHTPFEELCEIKPRSSINERLSHSDFVKMAQSSCILIGIEPAVARRFFTATDPKLMRKEIGENLRAERLMVSTFFFLEFATLISGIIVSIFSLKWFSLIAIPLMIGEFLLWGGMASVGRQQLTGAVAFVSCCLFIAYVLRATPFSVFFVVFPWPYFFARLTYWTATRYLRALVVRNKQAYELLYDKGVFVKWITTQEHSGPGGTKENRLRQLSRWWQLRRISHQLGKIRMAASIEDLFHYGDQEETARERLFSLCITDPQLSSIMKRYNATEDTLEKIYAKLEATGAGQWGAGLYIPVAAIGYPESLELLLRADFLHADKGTSLSLAYFLLQHFQGYPRGILPFLQGSKVD